MWEFSTDPEFAKSLKWIDEFVRSECEPLDLLFSEAGAPYDVGDKASRAILKPLQDEVRARACGRATWGRSLAVLGTARSSSR